MKQRKKATVSVKNDFQEENELFNHLVLQKSEEFEGPIPSPAALLEYGNIDSSFPNRILSLTESEQTFRHQIITESMRGTIKTIRYGQFFAFTLCVLILILAAYMAYKNHPAIATVIVSLDLVGLAAAFLISQKKD